MSEGLPDQIAGMMPPDPGWNVEFRPSERRAAAVLVLFIPPLSGERAARIVLTRRSTTVRSHKGQIGFAGGRAEPADRSPADTARRELEEELGIPRQKVTIIGQLPSAHGIDAAPVIPVVGFAAVETSAMVPDAGEVESVFAAPWTEFTLERDQAFKFNIFGRWRTSHLFTVNRDPSRSVWGLTAHILASARFS